MKLRPAKVSQDASPNPGPCVAVAKRAFVRDSSPLGVSFFHHFLEFRCQQAAIERPLRRQYSPPPATSASSFKVMFGRFIFSTKCVQHYLRALGSCRQPRISHTFGGSPRLHLDRQSFWIFWIGITEREVKASIERMQPYNRPPVRPGSFFMLLTPIVRHSASSRVPRGPSAIHF